MNGSPRSYEHNNNNFPSQSINDTLLVSGQKPCLASALTPLAHSIWQLCHDLFDSHPDPSHTVSHSWFSLGTSPTPKSVVRSDLKNYLTSQSETATPQNPPRASHLFQSKDLPRPWMTSSPHYPLPSYSSMAVLYLEHSSPNTHDLLSHFLWSWLRWPLPREAFRKPPYLQLELSSSSLSVLFWLLYGFHDTLSSPYSNVRSTRAGILVCSLLYLMELNHCLACNRHSANTCWITKH